MRTAMLGDVIASEWTKLRTVRSTYFVLGAALVALALTSVIAMLMTADWDDSPPSEQALFASADVGLLSTPFSMFCLAVLSGLAVAGEYGTGMIRTSLVTVPRRRTMMLARTVVLGGGALVAGQMLAWLAFLSTWLIVGDRPRPISPWETPADAIPLVLANGLVVMVVALVAFGLATVLRSSAGTLVTMTALLFVAPVITMFLPAPWNDRIASVMLPNLPGQLAAANPGALLSPMGAGMVLLVYVVLMVGGAMVVFARRDA
ncbi:ABC transporter permease [Amycolatopsis palatopharyngis]|uniref:ABC transporter permease n=1 Tax=Amycolatopsis palatopharyngis TaxID=187982 RepID=UPI000E22B367|nr:ABC transporter permease [Amycolatopsis palatopharyngis]